MTEFQVRPITIYLDFTSIIDYIICISASVYFFYLYLQTIQSLLGLTSFLLGIVYSNPISTLLILGLESNLSPCTISNDEKGLDPEMQVDASWFQHR